MSDPISQPESLIIEAGQLTLTALCKTLADELGVHIESIEIALVMVRDGEKVQIASTMPPATLAKVFRAYIQAHPELMAH